MQNLGEQLVLNYEKLALLELSIESNNTAIIPVPTYSQLFDTVSVVAEVGRPGPISLLI